MYAKNAVLYRVKARNKGVQVAALNTCCFDAKSERPSPSITLIPVFTTAKNTNDHSGTHSG